MALLHIQLREYQPTAADPFDRVKAAHLLNRAGFGGTEQDVAAMPELGPARAADRLLDFPDAPAETQDPRDVPDLSAVEGFPRGFRELRQALRGKSDDERKELRQKFMQANREALLATATWWVRWMVNGPHPLQEKLTLFWHGHFTTSARDERSVALMWQQNELLRASAAGNFREFVHCVARDPAMLDYLNNTQNHKRRPNENFARELMELFTLGVGNYTEADVKEAARAFTGWTHDGERFAFRRFDHDGGPKTIFKRTGNFDGGGVVDLILARRECPRHIAAKLYRFFVNEQADDAIVDSMATMLRDGKFELRPLLRTILTSRVFYSPANVGAQIKSPLQLVVGAIRQLGVEMPPTMLLAGALAQMGQVPFAPPNVQGWPGGRTWINTSTTFVRYNSCVWLAGGSVGNVPVNAMGKAALQAGKLRERPAHPVDFDPRAAGNAEETVDYWVARLIQRPIEPEKRKVLVDALGDGKPNEDAVRRMVQLIVSMPEYQLC